jgi:YD repeat-containing protein
VPPAPPSPWIIGQFTVIIAALLFVVALAGFVCWRLRRLLMPESLYRVEFDDDLIAVTHPRGERHEVRWDKLDRVAIRTTDGGPWELDLFWGFHEIRNGPSAVFPGGAPGGHALIKSLETRLPNIDAEQVARAMSSNGNAVFVVWESDPAR